MTERAQRRLAAIVAADVAQRPRVVARGIGLLLASSAVVCLDGIAQQLLGRDPVGNFRLDFYGRMTGPYENPNDLAAFLVVIVPIALAQLMIVHKRWKLPVLGTLVFALGCSIATASQGAALGLTVGAIHPHYMQKHEDKLKAYRCDLVYGTTSEFGFDYLRDNMKLSPAEQVQKHRRAAVVDEVDSTLIDEARTPLIISGPAHQSQPRYDLADRLARFLLDRQKQWNVSDQRVQSCLVETSGLEGDTRG